jgi:hypothetical protein
MGDVVFYLFLFLLLTLYFALEDKKFLFKPHNLHPTIGLSLIWLYAFGRVITDSMLLVIWLI